MCKSVGMCVFVCVNGEGGEHMCVCLGEQKRESKKGNGKAQRRIM